MHIFFRFFSLQSMPFSHRSGSRYFPSLMQFTTSIIHKLLLSGPVAQSTELSSLVNLIQRLWVPSLPRIKDCFFSSYILYLGLRSVGLMDHLCHTNLYDGIKTFCSILCHIAMWHNICMPAHYQISFK